MEQPTFNPKAPALTDEETKAAVADLVRKYPKVTRDKCDPEIPRQEIATISFKLLKEPKDGVVGLFKVGGAFEDADKATDAAERIIKYSDSSVPIHLAYVGRWGLITNNEKFTSDQMDVKTSEQENALRDRAAKEAELKKEQQAREIRERKKEMERERLDDDVGSLDYYTKKRVAERELKGFITQKEADLAIQKESLHRVHAEIVKMNKEHVEYEKQWLANYNKAREQAGLAHITEEDIEKTPIFG